MKKCSCLLFLIAFFMITTAMQNPARQKIVFFGDSITQMGTNEGGYIRLMQKMLEEKGKASDYELLGAGVGYNKVYDLFLRLEKDVVAQKPQTVLVWIGVNDVGHKLNGTGTDADKFEAFYNAIINRLKEINAKVILVTPAVIGERTDCTNQLDGDLNRYAQIVRKLAAQHGCGLIDMRKRFMEYNQLHNTDNQEKGILTTDGIHLSEQGNKLVADIIFKSLNM